MSKKFLKKKMPIRIIAQTDLNLSPDRRMNLPKTNNPSLNNIVYEYPISLLKEQTQFEKYKERLILSGKPKKEKNIINQNYHHIEFKSHSKSILLNPNEIFKNIKNKNILELYKNIFKNMQQINTTNNLGNKHFLQRNNINPLIRTLNRNNISTKFDWNNLFQKIYLNQIERRGFNYNKIKISALQRNAMNSFSRLDENFLENDKDNKSSFVLEAKERKVLPQMKTFFINKLNLMRLKNEYLNEKKFQIDCKPKGVINIKNSPNFKFHVYHDIKGNARDLGKPYVRSVKMTDVKMRDLILMNKIKQVRDPEIIQRFKNVLLE